MAVRKRDGRMFVATDGIEFLVPLIRLEASEVRVGDIEARIKTRFDAAFPRKNVFLHIDPDLTLHLCVNPTLPPHRTWWSRFDSLPALGR